jgi:SET domain-containing protein
MPTPTISSRSEHQQPLEFARHMQRVVIQRSAIHGRGVFATRRIEPGEVIIDGCREVLSDEAVKALPPEERIFLSVMDGQHILMKPPARFVNHSCNPNARGTDRHDVAIRVIEAGEEVTVDYVAEQGAGLGLECNCQAPNCRGLLVVPPGFQE